MLKFNLMKNLALTLTLVAFSFIIQAQIGIFESYAIINKLAFGLAIITSIMVLVWPSLAIVMQDFGIEMEFFTGRKFELWNITLFFPRLGLTAKDYAQ